MMFSFLKNIQLALIKISNFFRPGIREKLTMLTGIMLAVVLIMAISAAMSKQGAVLSRSQELVLLKNIENLGPILDKNGRKELEHLVLLKKQKLYKKLFPKIKKKKKARIL